MKKHIFILLVIIVPLVCVAQKSLVIENVAVIDVKTGKVNRDRTVVIRGNRIILVSLKASSLTNIIAIDGKGKYLIPGLWDMHTHALTDERYEFTFPLLIANGITGIREMGSNLPIKRINEIRKDVSDGKLLGPRMVLTYQILDGAGSRLYNGTPVTTPDSGRQLVRLYKREGADFIKPYNLLSRDVYLAIIDEARKQKIPLEGHVPFSMTAAEVSDSGQLTIEHNFDVLVSCSKNEEELRKEIQSQPGSWGKVEAKATVTYDEQKAKKLFERFVHNRTWSCPTIIFYRPVILLTDENLMINDTLMKYMAKPFRDRSHAIFQRINENITLPQYRKIHYEMRSKIVAEMHKAGVQILAGTDMGAPYCFPGFSLHQELAALVDAGLSPLEALRTATWNPAKFFGKEKDFGTIEKGKIADLVLLDANPLENISNTKEINAVIVNGKLLRRTDLNAMLEQVKQLAAK